MTSLRVFLLSLLACLCPAGATTVDIFSANFPSINLDVDADSSPDILSFNTTDDPPNVRLLFRTDAPLDAVVPEGTIFAWETFVDLADLGAAGIFKGTAGLTSPRMDSFSEFIGFLDFNPSVEPILAAWIWSSFGSQPTDPHHLIGIVVDASAHVANRADPITIYYAGYGAFNPGDSRFVSLADTMVPVPELPDPALIIGLDASRQNAVLEFVAHEGLDYQLRRSTDLIHWIEYGAVIPGDGSNYQETVPVVEALQFFQLVMTPHQPTGPVMLDIVNAGFEQPTLADGGTSSPASGVPGWTTMAGSGVLNPTVGQYPDEAPEGFNVAFIENKNNRLTQLLGETLKASTTYTLSTRVGRRMEFIPQGGQVGPDIYLFAGRKLTPTSSSTPLAAPGEFTTWTREYTIDTGHPGIGSPIEIVLYGGLDNFIEEEIDFDTVTLSAE